MQKISMCHARLQHFEHISWQMYEEQKLSEINMKHNKCSCIIYFTLFYFRCANSLKLHTD